MRPTLAFLPLLAAGCASGRAFHTPMLTDRPDFTESPAAVPARSVQVEAGATLGRSGGARASTLGEALVRVGVGRGAELRLGLPSYVRADGPAGGPARVDGSSDSNLGAKVELIGGAAASRLVPATALLVGAALPTGSRGLRGGGVAPEAKLLLSWSAGGAWALSSNVNAASVAEDGARVAVLAGSVSLSRPLGGRAGAFAEWFGARPAGRRGTHHANGGVTYLLGGDRQLDARAGTGLGANRRDFFLGMGLSQRW